jgi:hypothetical protein
MEHGFDRSYDAATPRLLHLLRHFDAMTLKPDDFLQRRRSQLHPRFQAWILTNIH